MENNPFQVSKDGYYGKFGGAFIPEMLHPNISELKDNYISIIQSSLFQKEYQLLIKHYVGRPTPLSYAKQLSQKYKAHIYLKREDLCHTGSHKINNTVGQILLAKALGKTKIIAETGAGQHGVATATVCSYMNMECTVFMGKIDIDRQRLNVEKMKLLGAKVHSVSGGSQTLKDATNEAMRYWISNPIDTHYIIGSVVGPHPYPDIVTQFQSIIGQEIKTQLLSDYGITTPNYIIACVGGGSNAVGAFYNFLEDTNVHLIAVEAAGLGVNSGKTAATIQNGTEGIIHGSRTFLMQTKDGQIIEPHSISAGLDYPGIGPFHSYLHTIKRVSYLNATDEESLIAGIELSKLEGIIPAIESAHAFAILPKISFHPSDIVIINLSGRGDKDMETYIKYGKY
ncbi:MAG: tryptophan synthase subunit beta [Chitinophagaceae bacterium]|nr:tryptophan synthase subunit beta [Chitinophagaceae bacterium]